MWDRHWLRGAGEQGEGEKHDVRSYKISALYVVTCWCWDYYYCFIISSLLILHLTKICEIEWKTVRILGRLVYTLCSNHVKFAHMQIPAYILNEFSVREWNRIEIRDEYFLSSRLWTYSIILIILEN